MRINREIASRYYETTASRGHRNSIGDYRRVAAEWNRRIGDWLPANNEAKGIELASGCGEMLFMLETRGYKNVVGVDLCWEEVAVARSYVGVDVVHSDILDFLRDQASNSVDFVVGMNIFEHFEKSYLLEVMKECGRIVKVGGCLIVMVPNAMSPFSGVSRHWDITHEWSFTTNNFRQLAALSGFSAQLDVREWGPIPRGLVSSIRYGLWQVLRFSYCVRMLVEVGTMKEGVFTMDMLVRLKRVD